MYAEVSATARAGMGRQETKYWIARSGSDTLRLTPDQSAMIAPPTSPYSQLSVHRRLPQHRHPGAPSSRVEQEQFTRRLSEAVIRARDEQRSSLALIRIDLDGFARIRA